jgi:hypothetical protein
MLEPPFFLGEQGGFIHRKKNLLVQLSCQIRLVQPVNLALTPNPSVLSFFYSGGTLDIKTTLPSLGEGSRSRRRRRGEGKGLKTKHWGLCIFLFLYETTLSPKFGRGVGGEGKINDFPLIFKLRTPTD